MNIIPFVQHPKNTKSASLRKFPWNACIDDIFVEIPLLPELVTKMGTGECWWGQ
jgi:hypothetical protein